MDRLRSLGYHLYCMPLLQLAAVIAADVVGSGELEALSVLRIASLMDELALCERAAAIRGTVWGTVLLTPSVKRKVGDKECNARTQSHCLCCCAAVRQYDEVLAQNRALRRIADAHDSAATTTTTTTTSATQLRITSSARRAPPRLLGMRVPPYEILVRQADLLLELVGYDDSARELYSVAAEHAEVSQHA